MKSAASALSPAKDSRSAVSLVVHVLAYTGSMFDGSGVQAKSEGCSDDGERPIKTRW